MAGHSEIRLSSDMPNMMQPGSGMFGHSSSSWVRRNSTRSVAVLSCFVMIQHRLVVCVLCSIGRLYHKMIYRAYTDASFLVAIPASPDWCVLILLAVRLHL
jgi:hypothetical protein